MSTCRAEIAAKYLASGIVAKDLLKYFGRLCHYFLDSWHCQVLARYLSGESTCLLCVQLDIKIFENHTLAYRILSCWAESLYSIN